MPACSTSTRLRRPALTSQTSPHLAEALAPYRAYAGATHALCNAHHLRELDALAAEAGQGWAGAMAEWLSMAKTHTERAKAAGASGLAPDDLSGWLARYDHPGRRGRGQPAPASPPGQAHPGGLPAGSAGALP